MALLSVAQQTASEKTREKKMSVLNKNEVSSAVRFYLRRATFYSLAALRIHFLARTTAALAQKHLLNCIIKRVRKRNALKLVPGVSVP